MLDALSASLTKSIELRCGRACPTWLGLKTVTQPRRLAKQSIFEGRVGQLLLTQLQPSPLLVQHKMSLPDFKTDGGLATLEKFLSSRSYIDG